MSSARKRQKTGRVAALIDNANQQKMLAKHHADVMGAMADASAWLRPSCTTRRS